MDGDVVDAYAKELIKYKARQLAGSYGYTSSDTEDIEQELTIHCWQRRDRYDPQRGQRSTFWSRIINNKIASMIERRRAAMRDYRRETSLKRPVQSPDDEPTDLAALLEEGACRRKPDPSSSEAPDLNVDLHAVVSRLPAEDRELCRLLQDCSPAETARRIGIPRGTLYDRLKCLRRIFEDAGLAEYLPDPPAHRNPGR